VKGLRSIWTLVERENYGSQRNMATHATSRDLGDQKSKEKYYGINAREV